jgi:hypothetical protein
VPAADWDATPYATDEDVFLEDGADFWLLVPRDRPVAQGTDGAIAADTFDLVSTTDDFEALGVVAGMLVLLEGARDSAARTVLGASGRTMVVDVVDGTTLTLRNPGQDSGVGEPPGGSESIDAVRFRVATLVPQLERASEWVAQELNSGGDATLLSAADLRAVTMAYAFWRLNLAQRRAPGDSWEVQAANWKAIYDELLARLAARARSLYSLEYWDVVPTDTAYLPAEE